MKKEEILKIAKELIYLSWTYDAKQNKESKETILKKLDEHINNLKNNDTKFANTVLEFVEDIKWDILAWRKLNIDNLKSDEYLENYFITKNEVIIYNNLITKQDYRIFFDEIFKKDKDIKILKESINNIKINFYRNLKKINSKNISKNLLIFTLFRRDLPSSAIKRLKESLNNFWELSVEIEIVNKMEIDYNIFLNEIISYWKDFYSKNNFNVNFLHYKISQDWNIEIKDNFTDASKWFFRSWNPRYEYKNLLSNIKK
jgi:hypothetical protein